jgi:hypothetical protein
VAGIGETGDSFGHALAAGDFDDDGFIDLAIGVPGEDTAINGVGAVNVLTAASTGSAVPAASCSPRPAPDGGHRLGAC